MQPHGPERPIGTRDRRIQAHIMCVERLFWSGSTYGVHVPWIVREKEKEKENKWKETFKVACFVPHCPSLFFSFLFLIRCNSGQHELPNGGHKSKDERIRRQCIENTTQNNASYLYDIVTLKILAVLCISKSSPLKKERNKRITMHVRQVSETSISGDAKECKTRREDKGIYKRTDSCLRKSHKQERRNTLLRCGLLLLSLAEQKASQPSTKYNESVLRTYAMHKHTSTSSARQILLRASMGRGRRLKNVVNAVSTSGQCLRIMQGGNGATMCKA